MNTQVVNFDHYFGQDNKLEIEATVQRSTPADKAPGTGLPASGGEGDILSCHLVEKDDSTGVYRTRIEFDPEGVFIRPWKQTELRSLTDDIERTAVEKADENGWEC